MRIALQKSDVLECLKDCPDNSFDALLTDPPYGLGSHQPTANELIGYLQGRAELHTGGDFMGKDWHVPSVAVWREIFRVLKPGAPLLVFSASRTQDLISLGMRAAGFEIRDCIKWIQGQGMPKPATTTDKYIGEGKPEAKPWKGYGHALRPSHEPIIVARKPLDGSIGHNVTTHGVGGLNIGGCRIGNEDIVNNRWTDGAHPFGGGAGNPYTSTKVKGRWPANVILDEQSAAALDEQTGDRPSTLTGRADPDVAHDNPGDNADASWFGAGNSQVYADSGGASRFFYCAKVNRTERNAGCYDLPLRSAAECTDRKEGSAGSDRPQAGAGRGSGAHNHHPNLKPLALTEYLARLILPPSPDAVLLVTYAGSSSEVIGALKAGWPAVFAVERDADYLQIAASRIREWAPNAEIIAA